MNKLTHYASGLLLAASLLLAAGCSKNDGNDPKPETPESAYAALLCVGSWPNTAYYIADVPSLTTGTISIQGNGAELTGKVYAQDVLQKDGYFYHANFGSGRLGKYHVENGVLLTDKEVPFTWLNWEAYAWADDETLIIFGNGDNEGRYAIVKVDDMAVTTGSLDLEAIPGGFANYNFGFAEYRDGKLFLGYGFLSDDWSQYPEMPVYPEFHVAVIGYPSMEVEKSLTDDRGNSAGGSPVYAPSSFVDEAGDLYFLTDPVNLYDYNSPSMLFRIKNGSTELDASYSFNLSAHTDNGMGAAIWYIGNGKAIVRTRVAGQSIDADHFFTVIDARNGSFIKKLDLPADKGQRMVQAIVVENGKAYIAVNGDRDFIWEYDPETDKLTKGAEFTGGIDFVLRLEKIK